MKTNLVEKIIMLYKQFYSELGKLLYAIADIDGEVSKKEKKALRQLIINELTSVEKNKDEFGTDAAFYTDIEFDFMDETIAEPEVAFESFINYIEDHKTAIDKRMISVARNAANKIAGAHYHTNKKEKHLLHELNRKLDALLKEK